MRHLKSPISSLIKPTFVHNPLRCQASGLPKCMYAGGKCKLLKCGKWAITRMFEAGNVRNLGICGKVKYLSYFCSNPLPLTIYVNANELHFSPDDAAAVCAMPS